MSTKCGRPAIPLWIDGVRFESTKLARIFLKATAQEQYRELVHAMESGKPYRGHFVTKSAPFPIHNEEGKIIGSQQRSAPPLLRGHCTERLGTYRDTRW